MIKVALTKGRIEKSALELLAAGGYDVSELEAKGRKLIFRTGNLEIVLAKAADVITYIDRGVCDVGFVGSDTINEYGGNFYEMLDLGFGVCRFALAGIKGEDFYSGYKHKVVATKYPAVARKYFNEKGVDCEIVKIDGSVELAPLLGLADAIVDIVETGATLKENGLEVYEDIVPVSTRCIVNAVSVKLKNAEINAFLNLLENAGVPVEHIPSGIDTMSVVIESSALKNGKLELVLQGIKEAVAPDTLRVTEDIALIATVGHGMSSSVGTSARLFKAMAAAEINVKMIDQGSSELNIIVGVKNEECEKCIRAIYREFFGN